MLLLQAALMQQAKLGSRCNTACYICRELRLYARWLGDPDKSKMSSVMSRCAFRQGGQAESPQKTESLKTNV